MKRAGFSKVLFPLMVASALLFSGEEARANFSNFCYTVTANATPPTFTYSFSPLSGCTSNTSVKNLLFEFPYDVPENTSFQAFYKTPSTSYSPLTCNYLGRGVGDPDTRLGVGDTRYNVLSCTSPTNSGFPKIYDIRLVLTQTSNADKYYLCKSQQVVQLKAGNSLSDSDTTDEPTLCNIPTPPPAPTISFFNAIPSAVEEGQCITLTWSSTGTTSGTINPGNLSVGPSGNLQVCPNATTTYTLALTGDGGPTSQTVTATVNPPATPSIMTARETIEKKDANGIVQGYVTFYYMDGALACSCTTRSNDQILPFPCLFDTLPDNCNMATDSDTNPVLVCLPFPGYTPSQLLATCNGRTNCGVLPDPVSCTDASGNPTTCYMKCDILETVTNDTSLQIGQNTCCAKTSTIRLLSGAYKTVTTWVPCSANETCP